MRPRALVRRAKAKGLDMIAICDHNSAENTSAFIRAGDEGGLKVLPGMEVTSKEEIHLIALFDVQEDCTALQNLIYENLPGENAEEVFGPQTVVNEKDEAVGVNRKMLLGATLLPFDRIVSVVHSLGGVAIASHIDREAFSIIGQLGFIPEGIPLDGLEISSRTSREEAMDRFRSYQHDPFVWFSDAHCLEDIGRRMTPFLLKERTSREVKMALHGEEGRRIVEA